MTNNHPGTGSTVAVPSPPSWDREAEPEVGGHAIATGGNVRLDGGTAAQRAARATPTSMIPAPVCVSTSDAKWSIARVRSPRGNIAVLNQLAGSVGTASPAR
jgi:hypothetical protein